VETKNKQKNSKTEKFIEDVDYYFENGLMVLTERFLKRRGYCCGNNCRHCPYQKTGTAADLQQKSL
jgi:hypothetical protein